jgi:signal transduction histidine kinase
VRGPLATRSRYVYALLLACVLAVGAWQWHEHVRFERAEAEALINRGRDITSTLGVVVRSQRRGTGVVPKDRIEAALQDLIRPGELEALAILGATGETIASAGEPIDITAEMLSARGLVWRDDTLTLMNLMDLGAVPSEDQPRPPIVVPVARPFRPAPKGRPAADTFGRPDWMTKEEYESVIQKQGVHSLVITLSTADMREAIRHDLLLRSMVSALAAAAALVSALAWRNVGKNAELQIRLIKAGEMNAHLAQMNLAAAGLAHETRNPLNLIRGLAHMLAIDSAATPRLKEHASTIIEEADRVTVQLNEFIHYSKPREAHTAPVELPRLAADVARTLQPDLDEKTITLDMSATPLVVEADEPLLRQALFNLLLNAVQAVDAGGRIAVRWQTSGREATIEISDNGPGVPAGERVAIFRPYVTMRPKGVGLGLAIVHQIVRAHDWEITCGENPPRGAVFRITGLKVATTQPAHAS